MTRPFNGDLQKKGCFIDGQQADVEIIVTVTNKIAHGIAVGIGPISIGTPWQFTHTEKEFGRETHNFALECCPDEKDSEDGG